MGNKRCGRLLRWRIISFSCTSVKIPINYSFLNIHIANIINNSISGVDK